MGKMYLIKIEPPEEAVSNCRLASSPDTMQHRGKEQKDRERGRDGPHTLWKSVQYALYQSDVTSEHLQPYNVQYDCTLPARH
eukprot:scaffold185528_cov51-Attheya_sp.AAC.3